MWQREISLCALRMHSQIKTAESHWPVPTQVTQGEFFAFWCGAAQLSFWVDSCKEVKCDPSEAWPLHQDWSKGITWRVSGCKGVVGESESSAPDVRIRSDFYAKEGMTQIYLNDQLKIVFFPPYQVPVLKNAVPPL